MMYCSVDHIDVEEHQHGDILLFQFFLHKRHQSTKVHLYFRKLIHRCSSKYSRK